MPEKTIFNYRLSKVAKEFNMGKDAIVKFLAKKGFQIDSALNTRLTADMYELLVKEFQRERDVKNQAKKVGNLSYKGGSVSIESIIDETSGTAPVNEEHKKKVKLNGQNETVEKKVVLKIPFSELVFGQGFVSITHKQKRYVFKSKRIKDYDSTLKQIYNVLSYEKRNSIKSHLVTVEIVTKTKTFTFKDINIRKTINDLKKRYLISKKVGLPNKESHSKKVGVPNKTPINIVQDASSAFKTMALGIGNIRFYNGYYLIFQTNDGEVDNTITPYRVNDPDSHEILNLVHKYFEQIFEQKHIIVKIDKTKILEPSKLDLFQLSNYVKTLIRNLDIKGEWSEEVQNERKSSLTKCRSISPQIVKKKVSMKNGYLDNLSSMQSEKN